MPKLNIFFDVDDTIITWDVKLRPGVHEVFQKVRALRPPMPNI